MAEMGLAGAFLDPHRKLQYIKPTPLLFMIKEENEQIKNQNPNVLFNVKYSCVASHVHQLIF